MEQQCHARRVEQCVTLLRAHALDVTAAARTLFEQEPNLRLAASSRAATVGSTALGWVRSFVEALQLQGVGDSPSPLVTSWTLVASASQAPTPAAWRLLLAPFLTVAPKTRTNSQAALGDDEDATSEKRQKRGASSAVTVVRDRSGGEVLGVVVDGQVTTAREVVDLEALGVAAPSDEHAPLALVRIEGLVSVYNYVRAHVTPWDHAVRDIQHELSCILEASRRRGSPRPVRTIPSLTVM